eukprot:3682127-Rhodomonas_salina.1
MVAWAAVLGNTIYGSKTDADMYPGGSTGAVAGRGMTKRHSASANLLPPRTLVTALTSHTWVAIRVLEMRKGRRWGGNREGTAE